MAEKNVLTARLLRDVADGVAGRLCQIIEQNQRPSEVEEMFMYSSALLNDRIEYIGHVYATARKEGLSARVLEAESLLSEIVYCFRNTLGQYDQRIVKRIDDFLRDEVLEVSDVR